MSDELQSWRAWAEAWRLGEAEQDAPWPGEGPDPIDQLGKTLVKWAADREYIAVLEEIGLEMARLLVGTAQAQRFANVARNVRHKKECGGLYRGCAPDCDFTNLRKGEV